MVSSLGITTARQTDILSQPSTQIWHSRLFHQLDPSCLPVLCHPLPTGYLVEQAGGWWVLLGMNEVIDESVL